jgi:FAD synthase
MLTRLTVEVNIFDFEEILCRNHTLYFYQRTRDEKRFGGLEQLRDQLIMTERKSDYC